MSVESVVTEFLSDNRISQVRHLVSEVEFVPKGFLKAVSVRIYQYSGRVDMSYLFETSHYVHTPLQADRYIASPWECSADAAANTAIEGILFYLEEAMNKGHEPHDGWLVENRYWT